MSINSNSISNTSSNTISTDYTSKTKTDTTTNDVKKDFVNENEDTAAIYKQGGRAAVKDDELKKIDATVANTEAETAKRMQNMVAKLVGQQVSAVNGSTDDVLAGISNISKEEATELVSEDGYFGVKETSGRILDMAKSLGGDDPDKIAILRQAVDDGFNEAAKSMGYKSIDDMPAITKDTYNAVMKGFDEMQGINPVE